MTTANGSGVINRGTDYANGSQVTSSNINEHVDNAVFNDDAVDDVTIGLNASTPPALYVKALGIDTAQIASSAVETAKINNLAVTNGKIANDTITSNKLSFIEDSVSTTSGNILVADGTTYDAEAMSGDATIAAGGALTIATDAVTPAKTSFLGTVDTTADSNVKIFSKQSDGDYDSVTPSGDVTMSQAGAFTIAANAVEGTMLNSNTVDDSTLELSSDTLSVKDSGITKAKIENVANLKVLGNTSGSAAAPQEVTINDTGNMSDASATTLATSESIKAYVDTETTNITTNGVKFSLITGSTSLGGVQDTSAYSFYFKEMTESYDPYSITSFSGGDITFASTGTYLIELTGAFEDSDTQSGDFYRLHFVNDVSSTTGISPTYLDFTSNLHQGYAFSMIRTISDVSADKLAMYVQPVSSAHNSQWESYNTVLKITKLS